MAGSTRSGRSQASRDSSSRQNSQYEPQRRASPVTHFSARTSSEESEPSEEPRRSSSTHSKSSSHSVPVPEVVPYGRGARCIRTRAKSTRPSLRFMGKRLVEDLPVPEPEIVLAAATSDGHAGCLDTPVPARHSFHSGGPSRQDQYTHLHFSRQLSTSAISRDDPLSEYVRYQQSPEYMHQEIYELQRQMRAVQETATAT